MPQPLTLAGAGSPSVIAGSKDIVGKANGAREVSCSRSRWPKSACHGEQGDGSPVLERYPWYAYPQNTQQALLGTAQTLKPQARPDAGRRPRLRTAPRKAQSQQGLTSEPRAGLGPCSLSLGELHPEAGVLLLLGEESKGRGKRKAQSGSGVVNLGRDSQSQFLPFWGVFLLSS